MSRKNPILSTISNWFQRNFSDPEALGLFFTLVFLFLLIEFCGKLLLPVIISVVFSYLLNPAVKLLKRWKLPHLVAVLIVFFVFVGLLVLAVFVLFPLLWKQLTNLIQELPAGLAHAQVWLNKMVQKYPRFFSGAELDHMTVFFKQQSSKIGQVVLSYSLASIPSLVQVVLYLILVPLLIFFFLVDGKRIVQWLSQYLPSHRSLMYDVWSEVNFRIGRYIQGRVVEIILVGLVTSIVFALLNLQYAALLGALVGLSVIVPYVGATVVTIPVIATALMQWGLSAHFVYLVIAYSLIIILDGNLLAPLLFAETMDLHPVVIILAVLVFGGIWGFWGVFFAIPLATLVKEVLKAWPRGNSIEESPPAE